jgi:putative tricarboxylic transport membrane protein
MFELFLGSFQNILTPLNLFLMSFCCLLGLIFGAIPGLSPTIALVLFLPITFGMDVTPAFSVLMALYIGGISGGLISAVLINIPGTGASVATCFDGAPMARKGLGGKALGIGTFYSFIGTLLSVFALIFLAPQIVNIAITFGPYEFFALSFFSLMLVAGLCGETMAKGVVSVSIGLLISLVGMGIIDGATRFTFGSIQLMGGFNSVPVMIGLFAIPEILNTASIRSRIKPPDYQATKIVGFGFTRKEFMASFGNMLRSAIIGIGIGILPGIGGGTSNIIAYAAAKNASKHPEFFGTGIMDGVVASETANNASIGGAMVPLLTLGIPGDIPTALLLGAFMLHGFIPGPIFFIENIDLVYSIYAAMLVCSFLTVIIQYFGMRIFVKILKIPPNALLPFVFMFCVIGAFAVNNRIFDVICLLPFGLLSYILQKYGYPLPPIVLGYLLGPLCEQNLIRGLQRSHGSVMPFFTRPVSCIFIIFGIVYVGWIICKQIRRKPKTKPI